MARQRIKHELIANESNRKLTFKKRKAGLLKKLSELTTLCGVMGCAIIYSAYNDQLEIWPPSSQQVTEVLDKFKESPGDRREKNSLNKEAFLGTNISKLSKCLERERKKNRELELELTLYECLEGKSLHDLNCLEDIEELCLLLDDKIKTMDLKSNQAIANNNNEK